MFIFCVSQCMLYINIPFFSLPFSTSSLSTHFLSHIARHINRSISPFVRRFDSVSLSLSLFLTPFRFVLFSFFFFGFTRRVYIVYVCLILRWAEPLVSSRDPHLIRNLLQRLLQRLSYPFKSFSPFHSPSFDRWKGIATPRDAKIDDQKARRICLSGISFLRSNRGYSRGFHGEPNSFDYKD